MKDDGVEELANALHSAGLNAFVDYAKMGRSGHLWIEFRKELAQYLWDEGYRKQPML